MLQKLVQVQRQRSFLRYCSIQCIIGIMIIVVPLKCYWSKSITPSTTTLVLAFTSATNNCYSKRILTTTQSQLYNPLCGFQSCTNNNNQHSSFYHLRNNKVITKNIHQQKQSSSSSSSLSVNLFGSTSMISTEPTIATTTFQLLTLNDSNNFISNNNSFISNIVFTLIVVIVPLLLLVVSTSTSYTSIMISSNNLTKEIESNENEMKSLKEKIIQSNQSKNNLFVVAIISFSITFSIGVLSVIRSSVVTGAVSSLPKVTTILTTSKDTASTATTTNQLSKRESINNKIQTTFIAPKQSNNLLLQQQSQQSTAAATTTLSTTSPVVEVPVQSKVFDSSIESIPKLESSLPVQVLTTKQKQEQEQLSSSSEIQSNFFQLEVTSLNNLLQKVSSVKTIATDNLLKEQQQNELISKITTPDAKLVQVTAASTTTLKPSSKIVSMIQQSDSLTSEITSLNRLQQKLDTVRIMERPLTKSSSISSIPAVGAISSSSSSSSRTTSTVPTTPANGPDPTVTYRSNLSPSSSPSVSTVAQVESLQSELPSLNKLLQKVNTVRINEILLPTTNDNERVATTTATTVSPKSSLTTKKEFESIRSDLSSLNKLSNKVDQVRMVDVPVLVVDKTTTNDKPFLSKTSTLDNTNTRIASTPTVSAGSLVVEQYDISSIPFNTEKQKREFTKSTAPVPVLSAPVLVQSVSVTDTTTIKDENGIDNPAAQEKLKQLRILKARLLELQRKLEVLSTESSNT